MISSDVVNKFIDPYCIRYLFNAGYLLYFFLEINSVFSISCMSTMHLTINLKSFIYVCYYNSSAVAHIEYNLPHKKLAARSRAQVSYGLLLSPRLCGYRHPTRPMLTYGLSYVFIDFTDEHSNPKPEGPRGVTCRW